MIYLDHAATTKPCREAFYAMLPFLSDQYANPSALYDFAREPEHILDEARVTIAGILDCEPDEIYFTGGGTESDNWILKGTVLKRYLEGRPAHIITTVLEHPAIKKTCEYLKKFGCKVTYLPVDSRGLIRLEELKRAISKDTVIISVMTANNEIGTIQPIERIGEIADEYGILFHTDAVQAFGHIPISVKKWGIDALSASAHKFGGPKGTGFLYLKKKWQIPPLLNGGHQEQSLRAGTENVPGIAGMCEAAKIAGTEMKNRENYERMLRNYMIHLVLRDIPDCRLNGALEPRLPGNCNFCFRGVDAGALLNLLDDAGICASAGSACSSKNPEPSEVLTSIGLTDEEAYSCIRFTLDYQNTREDVEQTVKVLKNSVRELRRTSENYS